MEEEACNKLHILENADLFTVSPYQAYVYFHACIDDWCTIAMGDLPLQRSVTKTTLERDGGVGLGRGGLHGRGPARGGKRRRGRGGRGYWKRSWRVKGWRGQG